MTKHQPPYVMGIDAGTEALKAALYDLKGNQIASGVRPYKTHFPRPGWAEQDPKDWWNSLVGAVRECIANAGVPVEEIIGVSADGTTCTMMPMTRSGQELRRCLLWMDVRATEQAQRIFNTGHPALRYSLAGLSAEWMPPKMLWFKENEPNLWDATDTIIEYTDWMAYKLTGRFTLNINTICHRWFYHTPSGGWNHDFFETIGLGGIVDKFPKDILRIGEVVGGISKEAAAATGLKEGTPVATGGGDAFIALFGQGVTQPGDMGIIMGSSNVMSALSTTESHARGIFGSYPDALLPGLNLVEGGQVSTGSILSWFKRHFMAEAEQEAKAKGLSVYKMLDEEATAVPPGSEGVIVLDYFQGNRTPHTDSLARGAIWGLSLNHGRGHVFRALMEGIAYGTQDILQTFSRQGFNIERIFASGGATRSPLFMQIYADVSGQTIYIPKDPEASVLGSAIVAAVGAGAYPDFASASQNMVTISGKITPDLKKHEQYKYFFSKYQESYPALKNLMQEMSKKVAG